MDGRHKGPRGAGQDPVGGKPDRGLAIGTSLWPKAPTNAERTNVNAPASSPLELRPTIPRLCASRVVLLGLLALPIGILASPDTSIASGYFRTQDWPVALAFVAALVAMTFRIPPLRLPAWNLRWPFVAICAVAIAAALWWGTYAIMGNYPLTRDEHMVLFDAGIFAKGHLLQPLAPEWRPYWQALVPAFAVPVPDHAGLASDYLPGNAMMRLAFSQIADPALMNPLLVALAGLAVHGTDPVQPDVGAGFFNLGQAAVVERPPRLHEIAGLRMVDAFSGHHAFVRLVFQVQLDAVQELFDGAAFFGLLEGDEKAGGVERQRGARSMAHFLRKVLHDVS